MSFSEEKGGRFVLSVFKHQLDVFNTHVYTYMLGPKFHVDYESVHDVQRIGNGFYQPWSPQNLKFKNV